MQISVLIEPVAGNGFRARAGEPFAMTVEGTTRQEVLSKIQESIQGQLHPAAEIVAFELKSQQNAWLRMAGVFKDDPLFDKWQMAIEEYRNEVEQGPDIA